MAAFDDPSDATFAASIRRFNALYRLPSPGVPTLLGPARVKAFQDILAEEVREGEDLTARYEALTAQSGGDDALPPDAALDVLTEMADWLGDVVVYCASEACRWGIPLDRVLGVIMESNFSKLGADGNPIYDDRGKVMKGPGYWRPEAKLRELLAAEIARGGRT
jgi:predicted HAD superfamily Cof-like phosphohydrolase